jgi:hypothetical protein
MNPIIINRFTIQQINKLILYGIETKRLKEMEKIASEAIFQ